jgi:uncharacterized protein (DUF1330 family)
MNYVKGGSGYYGRRMSVVLCVTLWPNPGEGAALAAYEDAVLALLPDHGGRVVARVRALDDAEAGGEAHEAGDADAAGHPFETQIIEFSSDAGVESYLADPRRTAASDVRDRAIARTDIQNVMLV